MKLLDYSGLQRFLNKIKTLLDSKSNTGHTHTVSDVSGLSTVATSGDYGDLSNTPIIPTVNNAKLTIQKNGTTVKTFTANASSNVTANITVPTAVSELTNDSGYLTSASSLDSSKLTGTIDIARLPKGALERLVTVTDQTARFALTTSDVQLGDTVKQLDTGVMYIVTDESKLSSADGYTEYTAGSATSVPWSGVTGKPSSFTPSSHTHGSITNDGKLGTASRALVTDSSKKIAVSSVTSTELGYLSGVTSAVQTQLNGKSNTGHTHSASEVSGLSTVATTGSYDDLSNKPTIPTVNNATLTIQKNGTTVKTFTANASSNVTANITVPTKTSDLTNDSHQTITVGTDTTSTASPAHGDTFTCIDSVTKDTNGHVTAVNTKTVTLPADNNTDTKMTQNVSTTNATYPILLCATADATANQGAKTGIFAKSVKVNPSTNVISASGFSGPLTGNVTGNCSGSSGSCTGNAATATQFSANESVTLTGYINGTASSKAGWSIATALKNCYYKTGGTVTNTYFKVASGTLTGAWNTYEAMIRISEGTADMSCTLRIFFSLDGSAHYSKGSLRVFNPVNWSNLSNTFFVVYNNDTSSMYFEVYHVISSKNRQASAVVLYEVERKSDNTCDVLVMYNNPEPVASLPSWNGLGADFGRYPTDFEPLETNTNDLGSSSYQWAKVFAQTYFYNGTAWGLDKANMWTGANQFDGSVVLPTFGSSNYKNYGIATSRGYSGYDNYYKFLRTTGTYGYDNTPNTSKPSFLTFRPYTLKTEIMDNVVACNNGTNNYLAPITNNSTDLGTSSLKWKTINGINPGELSFPNPAFSKIVDFSTDLNNITKVAATASKFSWTAQITGWMAIVWHTRNLTPPHRVAVYSTLSSHDGDSRYNIFATSFATSTPDYYLCSSFPVVEGVKYWFETSFSNTTDGIVYHAYILPCLGNV